MTQNSTRKSVIARASVPVIIICHNLLSDLTVLITWLEQTGHQHIVLLDNASTYLPLRAYLADSPHRVIWLRENLGHTAPWRCGLVDELGSSRPFVITDPDILPEEGCPADAVEHFQELLLRHQAFDKVGFGLRTDDIPPCYPHREVVQRWEAPFWETEIEAGAFAAHIDTTFAVMRPRTPYKVTEALRTAWPYRARHLPWYRDPRKPDAETRYFFAHRRDDIGYWNRADLPAVIRPREEEA